MSTLKQVELEYVYVTIPAEYICVYHRILAMLADFGEEMLKDCKASCTDRNSNVIECFNMFNAAVAARKLGKDKLAETLIKYIKAKINQIYKGKDNSTSFVFPVDENGQLKAFISCGERPRFEINPSDMSLYEHKFDNGFDEHFNLGFEDGVLVDPPLEDSEGLYIKLTPRYETIDDVVHACADLLIYFDGVQVDPEKCIIQYYFDGVPVIRFNDVSYIDNAVHEFTAVVTYNKETKIVTNTLRYADSN